MGVDLTHPLAKALSIMEFSMFLMVTDLSTIDKTQAPWRKSEKMGKLSYENKKI